MIDGIEALSILSGVLLVIVVRVCYAYHWLTVKTATDLNVERNLRGRVQSQLATAYAQFASNLASGDTTMESMQARALDFFVILKSL